MRRIFMAVVRLALLWVALVCAPAGAEDSPAARSTTCVGKFPNPITDICWSCIFPISIGSFQLMNINGQEDNGENPPSPICSCGMDPIIGLSIGFWEPARLVEVVRKPFCMVSLGGLDMSSDMAVPEAGRGVLPGGGRQSAFYQAHYYLNGAMNWLGVIADFACNEQVGYDLAYITEVDPLWNDDLLTAILNPEAVLFANPIAQAACAADCVKASTGFGFKEMFWCAGCQGGLYPLDGNIADHMGGVRDAELLTQRMMAKMHRELIAWGWHGTQGLCGPYLLPVMDKTAYKAQLLYPIPATAKFPDSAASGSGGGSGTGGGTGGTGGTPLPTVTGRCCQPFGRTTILWGAGKEYPLKGEDFSFILFRKRNCCVGYGY